MADKPPKPNLRHLQGWRGPRPKGITRNQHTSGKPARPYSEERKAKQREYNKRRPPRPYVPKPSVPWTPKPRPDVQSVIDPRFNSTSPVVASLFNPNGNEGVTLVIQEPIPVPLDLAQFPRLAQLARRPAPVKVTPLDSLMEDLASYTSDPLGFVLWAFPWGEPGTPLEHEKGPEQWQREQLQRVGQRLTEGGHDGCVIEEDVSSGHGVGKSALVSWMVLWAISTFEDTRGVVTANTDSQLRTKTWAELAKWYEMFIAKALFKLTATAIYLNNDPVREKKWRIDQAPWSKENTEAFAGMHNMRKRILVVFDEAAAIDDHIWEVTEGALTDANTQILWLRYGNPTRTSGAFFKRCLARGTRVLTYRRGWVPIESVDRSDLVWDGFEWVKQKGPQMMGDLFTIPVFNVHMTPDHKVMTTEGWRHGSSCEELDRAEVQLPYGYAIPRSTQAWSIVGDDLCLRKDSGDGQRGYQEGYPTSAQNVLRVQNKGVLGATNRARDVSSSGVRSVGIDASAMRQADSQIVEGLRGPRYLGLRSLGVFLRRLLGRHGVRIPKRTSPGENGEQQGVQQTELCVGYPYSTAQQHPSEHLHRNPGWALDSGGCSTPIRGALRKPLVPIESRLAALEGPQPVYDLIDCGPRQQFVVAGADDKALIVHNCTQGKRNTYTRVDSRTVSFSNKEQIQAWIDDYGEDSDFVRVRVKGQFPRAGYANFISPELVVKARRRKLDLITYRAFPKILSVDPARFGDDMSVITLRQGLHVPWQLSLSGFDGPDLASRVFELVRKEGPIACLVYDAIGNGADLDSALRRMNGLPPLVAVQWGQPAKDDKMYFNQRSECWGTMRDWLENGQIPDEDELAEQLTSLDFGYDAKFRIQLQSKKDLKKNGGKSPDKADSLALSFVPELIDRKTIVAKVRPVVRRKVIWSR